MKKRAVLLLVLLAAVCGMTYAGASGADVSGKLSVYLWDNEVAAQAAIDAYKARYPNVEIKLNITPFKDYQTKLFTSLAGGEDIDVFFMRECQVYPTYVQEGLCMKLDDLITRSGFDMTPYVNTLPQITVNGGIYEMPYRGGGFHMYYNKDLFDAAGVPYPDMKRSYTWAEFAEAAKKLTTGSGSEKVYGIYMMGWPWMQMASAMQRGTKMVDNDMHIDLDSEQVRDALRWYYDTCVTDGSQLTPAEATAINASITPMFISGKCAIVLGGDYMGTNLQTNTDSGVIKFRWGMARIPCDEGVEYSTYAVNTCACISSKAHDPDLAFHFLTFLAGEEGQIEIAKAGSKPAMTTDAIIETWRANVPCFSKEMADLYFENTKVFIEPMNVAAPFCEHILNEELSLYMNKGGQDLDTTIRNAVTRLQREIGQM